MRQLTDLANQIVKSLDNHRRAVAERASSSLTQVLPGHKRMWLASVVTPDDWRGIDAAVSGASLVELGRSGSEELAREIRQRALEAVTAGHLSASAFTALELMLEGERAA